MSESQSSPVFFFDNSDPEMQRAYAQARANFRYFWRELAWERRRIVPALDLACVKAPFSDGDQSVSSPDKAEVEQMWFDEIDFDGETVSGMLLSEPNWLKTVQAGDSVQIPLTQISDWMYAIGGEVYGAYTVNLMRSRMSPQERREHDQAWGLKFGDPNTIRLVPAFYLSPEAEHPMSEAMAAPLKDQLAQNPAMRDSKDDQGWTLLHYQALAGSAATVRVLLENGASPNAVTARGWTPLRLAKLLGWGQSGSALKKFGKHLMALHPRLGVSTWSLNKSISAGTPLLDIPAQVAAHGLSKLEVCHFHFPSTQSDYLARFRAALHNAGVEFYTLLIDEGDLTHPDPTERQRVIALMHRWIDVAAGGGAQRVRVIAGDAVPTPEALRLSADGLREVCRHAKAAGVDVVTENWHTLLDCPEDVLALLAMLPNQIGLKLDFGNWSGERKYADLEKVAPLADCTHAKATFAAPGELDESDFGRCLTLCRDAGFTGPHILIFSDPGDEWTSLDRMRDFARPYVGIDL